MTGEARLQAGTEVDDRRAEAGDRRKEIEALAAEMFFDRGYESTTMRGIASVLQIKSASLYYYFPDKEQILFEIVTSVIEQLTLGAKRLAANEDRHELKLAAVVVNHVVLHTLRPKATTLGDTELRSLTGTRRAANIRARDKYERFFVGVLQDGAKHAGFDLLDPKLCAYALIAQGSNVGIWYRQDGRLALEDVAYVQVGLALRAVGAEPVERDAVSRLCDAARQLHVELS
jgi:TetR/AcrR family transcriptional regulator, cholesterol catabolism regulator